jgi:oxygen-independent coproporphyrinogen-3 oxidase
MDGDIVHRTAQAIEQEIRRSPLAGRPAKTIFFGGGTPTFLPAPALTQILKTVLECHPPLPNAEITSEANPGTVDATKFQAMREAGFNRISLGAQSFLDTDLVRLGRVHRSGEIERAVAAARQAGFQNINLDLMFALPGQGMKGWEDNVKRALAMNPEHLSLYCLTIEENTAFYKEQLRGELILPEDEIQRAMYEYCCDQMAQAGYEQYEISNFAKPGLECRHNLEYWFGHEYAGYGPGAVASFETPDGRVRTTNLKHPVRYSDAVESGQDPAYDKEPLDQETQRHEAIMLGLRLNAGVNPSALHLPEKAVNQILNAGWAELTNGRLTLTKEGRHFCSEVVLRLF